MTYGPSSTYANNQKGKQPILGPVQNPFGDNVSTG